MNGDGAERLGEKILKEVEVEDLSSVCINIILMYRSC